MKRLQILMALAGFFVLLGTLRAEESIRTWQTKAGGKLDAVWDIEADDGGESIVLINEGKKYRVSLENLSDEDLKYVQERRQEASAEVPPGFTLIEDQPEAKQAADKPAAQEPSANRADLSGTKKAGDKMSLTIKGVDYTFCWCPAGSFMMGSPNTERGRDDDGEEVQHQVTLSSGFWMLETEVTQKMWESVMGNNPSFYKGENRPVEQVSWNDCQNFVEKLNQENAIPNGYMASLPSEAQWEYACRAGTNTPFNFGTTLNGDHANCDGKSPYGTTRGPFKGETTNVKSYSPNAWGLYDMHGNVSEWCSDWYDERYYANSPKTDPMGPASGEERVYRGGSWDEDAEDCRSAVREGDEPADRDNDTGFRLILTPNK